MPTPALAEVATPEQMPSDPVLANDAASEEAGNEASSEAEAAPIKARPAQKSSWTRWTTKRLRTRMEEVFGITTSKETIRRILHELKLSWKKAKKLLAKANPEQRRQFVTDIRELLKRATHDEQWVLAYMDEAHVHLDADLGYGWSERGGRLYVASSSPGLAKVSFYGIYLYSESNVLIWPYPKANGEHTIDVLERLRAKFAERPIVLVWDGASYHRSVAVREAATRLNITIVRLPAYSPDFMPVEALWRWMRESVTYNFCHDTAAELTDRVAAFVAEINRNPYAIADRLWVKDGLHDSEEELRFAA